MSYPPEPPGLPAFGTPASKRIRIALVLLTLAAFGLRLPGLRFQLPHRVEVDAEIVYQARQIDGVSEEPAVHVGTYPLVLPALLDLATERLGEVAPSQATLEQHRAAASADLHAMRLLVAILGTLIVPATFYLARRLVSDPAALLAAAMMSVSLLHVSLSQQARPHTPTAAFAAWAMLACLWMRRDLTIPRAVVAGLVVGLTLGTLHNGLALLLPLAAAWLWRERGSRWNGLAAAASVAAVAGWSYGTSWVALDERKELLRQGGHQVELQEFNGAGFLRMAEALWSYEPVLVSLALAGLVLLLRRRRSPGVGARAYQTRDFLVLASFLGPFVIVNGVFARFDQRFAMPLLPYLACLAAFATEQGHGWLAARVRTRAARAYVVAGCVAAVLALPLASALRLVQLRTRADTVLLATRWIEQNLVPGKERIAVMMAIDLPVFHDDRSLELNGDLATEMNLFPRFTNWFRYQREVQRRHRWGAFPHPRWNLVWINPWNVSFENGEVARMGTARTADYVVIERYPPVRNNPGCALVESEVRRLGALVATFSCYQDGCGERMHLEYEGPFPHATLDMTRTLRACARLGPCIEIYRMPRRVRG